MTAILGTALLAALLLPQQSDTTLAVQQGTSLQVDLEHGNVTVGTWQRSSVRVAYGEGDDAPIEVRATGDAIVVSQGRGRSGRVGERSVRISIPSWMPVRVASAHGDIRIDGTEAEVVAKAVHGSIGVRGGRNLVSATSVQGSVTVAGTHGRVEVESVNNGVRVEDVRGDVEVSAVNGGIVLQNVTGEDVRAETVNGSVQFAGPLLSGGFYHLSSHNGSVVATLPPGAEARVEVSAYNGEFVSDFPIQLNSMRSRQFTFTLGSDAARLELESFNGSVRLRRTGG